MRRLRAAAAACLLVLGSAASATAEAAPSGPPFPDRVPGRAVYDQAGALTPGTIADVQEMIGTIGSRDGSDVVVYLQTKPGATRATTLDDAVALAQAWGLADETDETIVSLWNLDETGRHGWFRFVTGGTFRVPGPLLGDLTTLVSAIGRDRGPDQAVRTMVEELAVLLGARSWAPVPATFPADAAAAWCDFRFDVGMWGLSQGLFLPTEGEPDLAAFREAAPGVLRGERELLPKVKADLAVLAAYAPTAAFADAVGRAVDALDAVLAEIVAADASADLGPLVERYMGLWAEIILIVGDSPGGIDGEPENCFSFFPLEVEEAEPAPTEIPEATPRPIPSLSASTTGWEAVRLPGDGWALGLASAGSGFIAVGAAATDPDGYVAQARAWASADGRAWTTAPISPIEDASEMADAVQVGTGFVAVGSGPAAGTSPTGPVTHAAAWTSPDGAAWTRVADSASLGGSEGAESSASMRSVAHAGSRVVAVGSAGSSAAAWSSSDDGRTWEVSSSFPTERDGDTNSSVWSVAAGGPGFVAVGAIGPEPIAWTSPDGVTWTQVRPPSPAGRTAKMTDLAASPDGSLVAVGYAERERQADPDLPLIWRSADGRSWTWQYADRPAYAAPKHTIGVNAVTWAGSGWIVVGAVYDGYDPVQGSIWTSADGRRWTVTPRDPAFGGTDLLGVAAGSGGILVDGQLGSGFAFDVPSAMWIRSTWPAAAEATPPTTAAEGPPLEGRVDRHVWAIVSLAVLAALFWVLGVRRTRRRVA